MDLVGAASARAFRPKALGIMRSVSRSPLRGVRRGQGPPASGHRRRAGCPRKSTVRKEPRFFTCNRCRESFGTRQWSWWSTTEHDRICEERCPYCGGDAWNESDLGAAAFSFMKLHHEPQQRCHGVPARTHPGAVARILREECPTTVPNHVIGAALLHDVLEDCVVTVDELGERFGDEVAAIVATVATTRSNPINERFARIEGGTEACRLVTVSDRLHNLREIHLTEDPDRIRRYLDETGREVMKVARAICEPSAREWAETALQREIDRLEGWLAADTVHTVPGPRQVR